MTGENLSLRRASDTLLVIESPSGSEKHDINNDCVVTIIPLQASSQSARLLYVKVADEPSDAKTEERTVLGTLSVSTPEEDILKQYSNTTSQWLPRSSNDSQEPNIYIIISGKSGGELARTVYDSLVLPFLDEFGLHEAKDYKSYETTSAEFILDMTKSVILPRAQAGDPQLIILLSGDGGIVDLINGLLSIPPTSVTDHYKKPSLVVLPMGTGNALAHSTGVTADRTLGLSTLARGAPKPLPLFRALFSPGSYPIENGDAAKQIQASPKSARLEADSSIVHGAVVFSYGLHASLVGDSDTPEYRKHGAARFQMAAQNLLYPGEGKAPHAYRAKLSVRTTGTGDAWKAVPRDTHAYVLATLVSQLEAGFTISPASQALDGQLRLVHFGPLEGGGDDIMDVMKAAYAGGKHVEDDRVAYEEIKALKLDFDAEDDEQDEKWRRVCIDGKIFVVARKGNVVVEREAREVVDFVTLK